MMLGAISTAQDAGARLAKACRVVGLSVRTVERWRARPDGDDRRQGPHRTPANALTAAEEKQVIAVLTSPRYGKQSPKQIVPQLADEGLYLASESTMYRRRRLLRATPTLGASRTHVARASTVHNATGPNQVWSWDITWLPTTVRGVYLHLYLVMDVWSRRVVGWCVAKASTADRAAALVTQICRDSNVDPRGLVLHSDNGGAMKGSTMLSTLQWLGIVPSFSRPHVSDDNPYSEALFRTLKYTPAYPQLPFDNLVAAERWVAAFVAWYNGEHRHSGIRYVTPDERHSGRECEVLAKRHELYSCARAANPERWSRTTRNWTPVGPVTLNPERAFTKAAA